MGRAFEYRKAAKEKRWGKMSRIFPKLARAITVAAKEGGIDPEMNAKLRTAIQNAKGENMPKDNIEAAIKRAEGKDSSNFVEISYEGKGPFGVLVFVECATDNPNRTIANIKSYFSKSGGSLVPSGSLEFLFTRNAVFEFEQEEGQDIEELELNIIDAGVEKVQIFDNTVVVYGDYVHFGSISKALEENKIDVKRAVLERIPTNPIRFDESHVTEIEVLLEKLENDDDVQSVYTNLE